MEQQMRRAVVKILNGNSIRSVYVFSFQLLHTSYFFKLKPEPFLVYIYLIDEGCIHRYLNRRAWSSMVAFNVIKHYAL